MLRFSGYACYRRAFRPAKVGRLYLRSTFSVSGLAANPLTPQQQAQDCFRIGQVRQNVARIEFCQVFRRIEASGDRQGDHPIGVAGLHVRRRVPDEEHLTRTIVPSVNTLATGNGSGNNLTPFSVVSSESTVIGSDTISANEFDRPTTAPPFEVWV